MNFKKIADTSFKKQKSGKQKYKLRNRLKKI